MRKELIKYKTILLMLVMLPQLADAQSGIVKKYDENKHKLRSDSLAISFGKRKKIPDEFKTAFYLAIGHFEELKTSRIKIKSKKIKTTMSARPTFLSSFRKKTKRKYIIFVNTKNKNGAPLYSDFTFNARVGILGHELAHILHYTNTPFFKLAREGINYRKEKFKSAYEKSTDSLTIAKGLGWQVYDFTAQLHALPNVPQKYKDFKLTIYYSPRQLLSLLGEMGYEY